MSRAPEEAAERPSARQLAQYFLGLGALGFGGPIALVGRMERDLVMNRRWVARQEFNDGLAFAQLAPGPLAAQLAIYLGWLRGGVRGATLAGIAFIGPSFLMVIALAFLYRRFGGMAWLHGAFYGIGAAVIAVIARSAARLVRTTLRGDVLLWILFLVSAGVTAWTESEIVWLFLLCGVVVASRTRAGLTPERAGALAPAGAWLATASVPAAATLATPAAIFLYFATAGLFVFGSGLAIVPFLHGGVVQRYHWLTEREFIDAVAVALITPGPVVITVAFIGYLVAGVSGATAAALGVFAPVYFITILFAPHYQRLKENRRVRAFVAGVTAAATGAIAGAAFVLGKRALIDLPTVAIAVTTLVLAVGVRRLPEPIVILSAGVAGVLITARGT